MPILISLCIDLDDSSIVETTILNVRASIDQQDDESYDDEPD